MAKKKLTFLTLGSDSFLRDIILSLRRDYEIKIFQNGTEKELKQLLHDTDIAWFEFCDQLIGQVSKSPQLCKYIVRLHSYEMFTDLPKQVNWNEIDKLVFVNEVVHDYTMQKFQIRPDICEIVHNGVNCDKFQIPKNKSFNKKVAFVGYMNYKKGPQMLIEACRAIYEHDPEYTFHVAGAHQDERIHLYFQTMENQLPFKINFDGWVNDVPKYLEDKDFVISSSLFESFQYSIAEGMAQGCIPLVHCWVGSNMFYPKEYIFSSPEKCVEIVKNFEAAKDKDAEREKVRKHIVDNFSLDKQINQIKSLLESL